MEQNCFDFASLDLLFSYWLLIFIFVIISVLSFHPYRQKFVSDRESAGIILRCLNEHCMNGKTSLTKLFICETNNHKLAALSDQLKAYGPGIEYEANRRPGKLYIP